MPTKRQVMPAARSKHPQGHKIDQARRLMDTILQKQKKLEARTEARLTARDAMSRKTYQMEHDSLHGTLSRLPPGTPADVFRELRARREVLSELVKKK